MRHKEIMKKTRTCSMTISYQVVDMAGKQNPNDWIHSITIRHGESNVGLRRTGRTLNEVVNTFLNEPSYGVTLDEVLIEGLERKIASARWAKERDFAKDLEEWDMLPQEILD